MSENVKIVYDVVDIMNILNIGRNKAYNFIKSTYEKKAPFVVVRVGKDYKIPKDSFMSWLQGGEKEL